MKKKLLSLALFIAIVLGALGGGVSAFASVSLEECDRCFQATANSILDKAEVDGNRISAERRPLYDLKLNQLGYVYAFKTAEGDGYAIIICDNGVYAAREFVKENSSPYADVEENFLCVYANTMSYYKGFEGNIYDIKTSAMLPEEAVNALLVDAVFYQTDDSSDPERVTVSVPYTSVSYDVAELCLRAPQYGNFGLSGGCAAMAGGNLIGYYDRFYEDLIPNHTAGKAAGNYFSYSGSDEYVRDAIRTLYADMNGAADGITEANFKKGMQTYCARKGFSCDFSSLKSGGSLDYDSVKSSIRSGYPIVLLLNTFNICELWGNNENHRISYEIYKTNHVMAGFAFRDSTYTLTNGSTSRYRFIEVSTGWVDPTSAYFNIDYCTNIVSAYKVDIH